MKKCKPMKSLLLIVGCVLLGIVSAFAAVDPTPAASSSTGGSLLNFFFANETTILAALLAISEVLARIPGIKANSIFELVTNFLKVLASGKPDTPAKVQ